MSSWAGISVAVTCVYRASCIRVRTILYTVSDAPGFTTVAVTEQNIAMALDALYGKYVQKFYSKGASALHEIDIAGFTQARTVAQIIWFMLLSKALRLDAMYEFGAGDKYVRTGVRRDATVYHDQLGQYEEAGICNSIGIIGLDEVGLNIIELAMAHELSVIYVLDEEYQRLSNQDKVRLDEMLETMKQVSQTKSFSLRLLPVEVDELISKSTYTIKTPAAYKDSELSEVKAKSAIGVYAHKVFIKDPSVFDHNLIGTTFGVQGLGRIGEAVV